MGGGEARNYNSDGCIVAAHDDRRAKATPFLFENRRAFQQTLYALQKE